MIKLIINLSNDYDIYLSDESRQRGYANSISFPNSEEELVKIIKILNENITIQGARTGLTAGCVPYGGHIMNLSKMNKFHGLRFDGKNFYLTLQPGVILLELTNILNKLNFKIDNWSSNSIKALTELKNNPFYFFPPDPTETSASIGGMVACNSSGACSYYYGPVRNYITRLRIITANGSTLDLKRGEIRANNYTFSLATKNNEHFNGKLPTYKMLKVKNSSGYYTDKSADLIDVFIGSEGTLGIISEIEIKLIKKHSFRSGIMIFFRSEEDSINFVCKLKSEALNTIAIEFFNNKSLELLSENKKANHTLYYIPNIRDNWHTGIYVELTSETDDEKFEQLMKINELIENYNVNDNDTWIAMDNKELEKMKKFRHSVPEFVNLKIDKIRQTGINITKLSTDMSVPDNHLKNIIKLYNSSLIELNLDYVMFGHIGNNHIHVNIIPRTMEEYAKGKSLYQSWAKEVVKMGGSVSAEHGIGKLKSNLLYEMFGNSGITQMADLKRIFDNNFILNEYNLGICKKVKY